MSTRALVYRNHIKKIVRDHLGEGCYPHDISVFSMNNRVDGSKIAFETHEVMDILNANPDTFIYSYPDAEEVYLRK